MPVRIRVESTPNPNALKFILNCPVKTIGKISFKSPDECHTNPLARHLFSVSNVSEVYFFDNVITVTQDGNGEWEIIEEKIKSAIMEKIAEHDPNFEADKKETKTGPINPELAKIEEILDRTIRPALQGDGGDLQVISLEGTVLTVNYQGACGSCPSSTAGTLKAIEGILQTEYNSTLTVEAINNN